MCMTKTEQKIVDYVQHCNYVGALAGLGNEPDKFVKRLVSAGKIARVPWSPKSGAGWAIVGHKIAAPK
jgi:hypothetical protein